MIKLNAAQERLRKAIVRAKKRCKVLKVKIKCGDDDAPKAWRDAYVLAYVLAYGAMENPPPLNGETMAKILHSGVVENKDYIIGADVAEEDKP